MRNLCILLLIYSNIACSQNDILKPPQVDKRIELLSIVFRLAESEEYSSERFSKYTDQIKAHFEPYKNHALIQFIKDKLRPRGVGFDAVMAMAIHITDPPQMEAIIPFSNKIPETRWGKKQATAFLKLLNDFYTDADCESFFKAQADLYRIASKRFTHVYKALDLAWYREFYGTQPKGEFRIINGLGNGGGNYGPKIILEDGQEIIYAIMGTWRVDSLGLPNYKIENYFPVLLHEFNHSFVNHLVEAEQSLFKNSGKIIYEPLAKTMRRQAYTTWKVMIQEAIVRAAVVQYLKEHYPGGKIAQNEINTQVNRGFIWTKELVDKLGAYANKREQYPNLESFIPELAKFFDGVATRIDTLISDLDDKRPQVVSLEPFNNEDIQVDPHTNQIKVHFNQPLRGGNSINYGPEGKEAFPKIEKVTYSEDKKTVIIALKLEPNKEYTMVLTGRAFRSVDGLGMHDYAIHFKTGE